MPRDGEARSNKNCRARIGTRSKSACRYFQEFSDATTLHGIRYIAEPNRHPIERLFWVTAIVICSLWCGLQIEQLWARWQASPVIVTLSEKSTKIWDIPFPAITVCPENKIKRSRFDIEKEMEYYSKKERITYNKSQEDLLNWQTVSMMCGRMRERAFNQTNHLELNHSHLERLHELGYDMRDVACDCKWGMFHDDGCEHLLRPIITDEGLCYTFNMLQNNDIFTSQVSLAPPGSNGTWVPRNSSWDPGLGYRDDEHLETSYPFRAVTNGFGSGLGMLLRVQPDEMQPQCNGDAQSVKLMVHSVTEFPNVRSQFLRLPLDSAVNVAVRPDMITTAHALKNHKPIVRGCYFPDERNLSFFKVYTQQNCEMECFLKAIHIHCNCQPFYLPITSHDKTYCYSQRHDACIKYLQGVLHNLLAYFIKKDGTDLFCKCLPSCSENKYHLEITTSQFNISNDLRTDINTSRYRYIKLAIYFKDMQFIHNHRSELYSTLDFLANCGGLLGLFTGFSITSAIEICYFLSMRLACNLRRHRQERRGVED